MRLDTTYHDSIGISFNDHIYLVEDLIIKEYLNINIL